MSKIQNNKQEEFYQIKRIQIYIYSAQLEKINEICLKRKKSRRIVFFEAIQTYISLYEQGKL